MGKKIVANIIMLGFFTAICEIIIPEAMEHAIRSSIPEGFEELNINAFRRGLECGINRIKKKK